jgi:hypothetical protein
MPKSVSVDPAVRKFLSGIGRKGGVAKGPAKSRGNSDYYRNMRLKAVAKKPAKSHGK